MKYLLVLLIMMSSLASASECRTEQVSQMTGQRKVGAVTDLSKDISHNKCQVKFRINVDGEWHTVDWTHSDMYQPEVICQMAIRNGINALLVKLPGQYQTESRMICKPKEKRKMIAVGYEAMELEFGFDPQYKQYFKVGNVSKCRKFVDYYNDGHAQKVTGIICLNKNELWTVVDKF